MRVALVAALALSLASCADHTRDARHLVFADLHAMAVVENIQPSGAQKTASLIVLVPQPAALDGKSYIGTRSEEVVDCGSKRSRRLSLRGVLPDWTEAAPVSNRADEWTSPGPATPSGRMIQAVCQAYFARSTLTHKTLKRLRETWLRQLAET